MRFTGSVHRGRSKASPQVHRVKSVSEYAQNRVFVYELNDKTFILSAVNACVQMPLFNIINVSLRLQPYKTIRGDKMIYEVYKSNVPDVYYVVFLSV